uniref:GH25 family lysozyme n=1 Tax=Pseudobutyrivibrio sp. TaxID=2014367 RepID=UPI003870D6C2
GYGNMVAYPYQKDPTFETNYKNAKAAGLSVGTYFYSYALDADSAKREAQGVLNVIKGKQFDYPIALDIEENSQMNLSASQKAAVIEAFISVLENAGYYVVLYSYESFLNSVPITTLAKYDIWCANINRKPSMRYGIWQDSWTGRINGINGDVDTDIAEKDYPAIIKGAGLNGFTKTDNNNKKTKEDITPFDKYFAERIGKGLDWDKNYGVQCFTKDHYVLMADWTYKAIQDIQIGDKVIGYDNEVNTVVQLHRRKADVIKVRTNLSDIIVTEDHPFYYKDGSFDSILASNQKTVAVYDKCNYTPSGLTDEELLFLGFWLGDGCLARHKDNRKPEIRITYGTSKVDFVESLGMITNVQPHTSGNGSFNASIRKREHPLLTEIIYKCYNENKEKVLPLIFTNREYDLIIDGYIKADGCEANGSYAVSSTSKSLLLSIQAAAILCGYGNMSIRPMKRSNEPIIINGKVVKNVKPIWKMTIVKKSTKHHKPIVNVEYLGEEEVYNIGTDGTHTYICDNYKVHNCFDLANDYSVNLIGGKAFIGMGAYEIYTNYENQPSKDLYERIPNTPEFVPIKGDIMVWGQGLGKWGHVAICNGEGDTTWFESYEQNWTGNNDPVALIKHNYNSVLGVLRPKDQTRVLGKTEIKVETKPAPKTETKKPEEKVNTETTKVRKNGDVNGDGVINISDVIALAAHVKGKKLLKD